MPRLFVCLDCQTIDVFPLLTGEQSQTAVEDANRDPLLNDLTNRHLQKHRMDLVNQANPASGFQKARVFVVEDQLWEKDHLRTLVLKNIKKQWAGFEPELYAVKDTFQTDALKCFSAHSRPKAGCIDWREDSKLLTPSSWKSESDDLVEKSDLKKIGTIRRKPIYLCDFCPVKSYYLMRARADRGMYKETT
jgi:hypothetical protein